MTKRSLQQLLKITVLSSATLLALPAQARMQERATQHHDRDDDRDGDDDRRGHHDLVQVPSGQYVTPTAVKDAAQTYLNPVWRPTRTSWPARRYDPA
jgi:hypothetical protein